MTHDDLLKVLRASEDFDTFKAQAQAAAPGVSRTGMAVATPGETKLWTPLLGEAGEDDPILATGDLILRKGDITLCARQAGDLSHEELGAITQLHDAQVGRYPGLLNRFDPEAARNSDSVFAYASRGRTLIAAAMGTREAGAERRLHLGATNSDGSVRGIAVPLLAALVRGDAMFAGKAAEAEAYIRVMPDGATNRPAAKMLMRLGFYPVRYHTHPVTWRNPQKAATGSMEPDGGALKYLLLQADRGELAARVALALQGWHPV